MGRINHPTEQFVEVGQTHFGPNPILILGQTQHGMNITWWPKYGVN